MTDRSHALSNASERFRKYRKQEEKEQFVIQSKMNEYRTATKLDKISLKSRYDDEIEKLRKDYNRNEVMVRSKINEIEEKDGDISRCVEVKEHKFLREMRALSYHTRKERKDLMERHQSEIGSLVNEYEKTVTDIKMNYNHQKEKYLLDEELKKQDYIRELKNRQTLNLRMIQNYASKRKEELGLNATALNVTKENLVKLRNNMQYIHLVGKNLGIQHMKEKAIVTYLEQRIMDDSRRSETIQKLRFQLAFREDLLFRIMRCTLSLSHKNVR